MKAMILCAGLGTRLRPWTLEHPKALVPVGGIPMLKRVSDHLAEIGFDRQVVNVHHFASQIVDYINGGNLKAPDMKISDESECLLDTGGGILHARKFLDIDDSPFLIHNVDILSDADLNDLMEYHYVSGNDVTLLVSDRDSSRKLLFREDMCLKGWMNLKTGESKPASLEITAKDQLSAFSGIYVMSPSVFKAMDSEGFSGSFPIMSFFLDSIGKVKIGGYMQEDMHLIDIGKPDTLSMADGIANPTGKR